MDLLVVALIVAAAAAYTGFKLWSAVKPGPKATGCSCGHVKSGCSVCPLVKP